MSEILDSDNEHLFGHILRRRGRERDLAVLVTASGDSLNILDASRICRQLGITTISVSANGRIANILAVEPDYPIVIPMGDQQKLEEVTLGTLLILARQAGLELAGRPEEIAKTREQYIDAFVKGVESVVTPKLLLLMVDDIVTAFRGGSIVRIDATAGVLESPAEHMVHNLIWDARDEAVEIWSNKVLSGLLPCHMTGVGNDGGCGFNTAIEVLDNGRCGDVEIVLATTMDDIKIKALLKAAEERKIPTHVLCFGTDRLVAPGLAQMTAHLTGRLTNTRILLEQGVITGDKAKEWMRKHDLALLRKKEEIRDRLQKVFAKC